MSDVLAILLFLAIVIGAAIPIGWWLNRILFQFPETGRLAKLDVSLSKLLTGKGHGSAQSVKAYLVALLVCNAVGLLLLFAVLMCQALWDSSLPSMPWYGALNIAVSFVTNTNWQWYSGEVTLSPWTQALGLTVQNFVSAASGIAVLAALTRTLAGRKDAGNLWNDMRRIILYILLPLSIAVAVVFVVQGVPQTFTAWLYGGSSPMGADIPVGPVASQVAIKQLGSNGGGFYGVNSAHPLENPTWITNALQQWGLLVIPAACVVAYGLALGRKKHAAAVLAAMSALFVTGALVMWASETQYGGMEGKDVRIGTTSSVIWAAATTAASNGSVNAMHSSLSPLAGFVTMANMITGEVIFGGVGAGMYGMTLYIILAVFLCGLMIGRTPEYLGIKLTAERMKPVLIGLLLPTLSILVLVATALLLPGARAVVSSSGPHALSEILYAVLSAVGNNGSAFAGLSAGGIEWTTITSIGMLVGRYGVIIPVLLFAHQISGTSVVPSNTVQFSTHGPLFVVVLIGTIVLIGVLTAAPMLVLGPVADHLLMGVGQ